jgi:hypothetical protein
MLRKTLLGLFAAAALSMLSPTAASARFGGGFHGGGFHGGGFHGFHGGGFHHHGFGGVGLGLGLGLGLAAAPLAFSYGYPSYAYYGGGCYLVPRRVWTPWGWRFRSVEVCD